MTGREVAHAARGWVGVRYRHQGRSRDGVDCVGLPICVRAELGLAAMDWRDYERTSFGTDMLDIARGHLVEIAIDDAAAGDLLVAMNGAVRHMAIVADYTFGGLSIIHAWLPARRVGECRLDDEFMRTVRGCFRFPEVRP